MGDPAHPDEHRVDPGALERQHLVPALDVDAGDRELAGRYVGQELQHRVERVGVGVSLRGGEQEDLGIALLERELELLLVPDVDDRLQVVLGVLVLGPRASARRRPSAPRRRSRAAAARSPRGCPRSPGDGQCLRALFLGVSRAARVVDAGDDCDPVTFRDALAEAARPGHVRPQA